jgi:Family of unknown function (DUF6152)
MHKTATAFTLAVGLLLGSGAASAHHARASFDTDHQLILKGTVANFKWANPHAFIFLDVKDEKGNVDEWRVEGNSPNMLARIGWSRELLKPGDQISVSGSPAKDGEKILRLESLTLGNGRKFDGQGFNGGVGHAE